MKHHKHQKHLDWQPYFPFPKVRPQQEEAMDIIVQSPRVVLEQSTGVGKTAEGICFLKWLQGSVGLEGALLYVTPTKALVNQVAKRHPEVHRLYGRHEYECPLYHEQGVKARADEIPCATIVGAGRCPYYHVSMGKARGSRSCPYFDAKKLAEEPGKIVAMTTAYFLLTKLYLDWPEKIAGLVIDEVHQIAKVARLIFKYDITDYHLKRLVQLLEGYDVPQATHLEDFLKEMIKIAQLKPARQPTLLKSHEIGHLLKCLEKVNLEGAKERLEAALARGELDPVEHQEELMTFEQIGRNLKRYLNSFYYALADEKRHPLNYIFAYYEKRIPKTKKVRYRLCVRAHYVGPLIRRCLQHIPRILGYSATIGDPVPFTADTGIDFPTYTFPSVFPPKNARIFLPSDTPNLAYRERGRIDVYLALRKTAQAALEFQDHGVRSLVVVESEKERRKFLELAQRLGVDAVSYGDGIAPKEVALNFINGQGMVLVGTAANYSHGIDLPGKIAPVIFILRPGYPRPQDPATQFEVERFGRKVFEMLKWWRALTEVLQTRGRNIRAADDLGVAFLISQQFGRFLPKGLPEWLQDAWVEGKPMRECVAEATTFLKEGGYIS